MQVNPFAPDNGANQAVTTGAASASITLKADSKCVRIVNTGATNPAHVRVGIGAQTATAADLIIRPNSEIILYKGDQANTLAHIQNTGATTLFIQTGDGSV
jgi:hypothetical protein